MAQTQALASFAELQLNIRQIIADAFAAKKLELGEVMAYLDLFGLAENIVQLRMLVNYVETKIPGLERIRQSDEHKIQLAEEKSLQDVMMILSQTDPKLASEIGQMANEPGVTLAEVVEKFPYLESILN